MIKKNIKQKNLLLCTTDWYIGKSIEEKMYEAVNNKAPIENVAPMVYTERRDGVLPETNIRTDRFEIAQEAMDAINRGIRENRAKRILDKDKQTDKPITDSGNKTAQSVQE